MFEFKHPRVAIGIDIVREAIYTTAPQINSGLYLSVIVITKLPAPSFFLF
jgi:hypothetical protein